ncbi:MAG: helicase HerA domain-containing protein [Candidatus Thorarchaeota archaeon]
MVAPDFFLGRIGNEQFKLPSTTFLTHAAILGASGSGKTVVCKSIVEEAIRADIPVIAIDPKGDIGALGIGLGEFDKDTLIIHAQVEAEDRGHGDPEEIAEEWIQLYQNKLEDSFGPEYLSVEKEFSNKVAVVLITPKNAAGVQISLTPSFEMPTNYEELMTESPDALLSSLDLKIQLLLSRCGIGTTSSTDNRVIFLSNIIRHIWEVEKKKAVTLENLIEAIEDPPFEKVGSLAVEKFISKVKRTDLARKINALMVRAVPGVDLNFDKFIALAKKQKRTPIIVFDLRKITDSDEKSTFVAEILGEVQRWVWSKGGTSRLRAILYFDELYGFMPAGSLSPPSKTALLIILKQARAAGLGCVLATQNPGDLDYRGLSNIATWILGRLATNQDVAKVQGALKPVFEGAGGSEEDFRKLMSQIRALKPGNFIAYNPRYGVNELKTRWLLSLHKGPLTDSEIEALTLRPPKPEPKKGRKKEKIDTEVEEKVPSKHEFTKKKPSVGKITERFLIPKISQMNVPITVYERLSIQGNPEVDGFDIEFDEQTQYYAPLYFSKTLINIKREVKEGSIIFPVEITETMSRSFDLSTKIKWDQTTVEGIHASSLPPEDLTLSPNDDFVFHTLDKEIITKLPDNLVWYFTQSPFPEAGNIYQKKLREFEVTELEKLAGKKESKAFSKISKDMSKIEERIETENQRLDETLARIEVLQAEKKARSAEGRSIKAVLRSLETADAKILRHEERKKELQNQLRALENKREEMIKEQKTEYAKLHQGIENLKKKGAPMDLYRPGKADIKIEEKAVYWIPRLLIPISFTIPASENDNGGIVVRSEIDLNLYNGNAELYCDGCGPEISTENYYQTILASEISPPTFICTTCLNTYCSEHISFCEECGKISCLDHDYDCLICKKKLCGTCRVLDTRHAEIVCKEHSWQCIVCQGVFSSNYEFKNTKEEPVCEDCAPSYLLECQECGKFNTKDNSAICEGCSKSYCAEHLQQCRKCKTNVCNDCGRVRVKLKGEEVIAQCIVCS